MTFTLSRNRDAWPTIRGYVYQVQLTIDRWLRLGADQVLELERGEDIDIISGWTADGAGDEQRVVEQIKHLDHSISLNSNETRSALANFVEHRSQNLTMDLQFRFVTTAKVAKEQKSPLPKGVKGIEAWEAIRAGTLNNGTGCLRTLAGIRRILKDESMSDKRPSDLSVDTWKFYQTYLRHSRGADLLLIILAFEWSTGQKEPEALRFAIEKVLCDQGWAESEAVAKAQYNALFAYVFHRLTLKGIKRLDATERDKVLARPELGEADRKILENLESITARFEKLEAKVDAHEDMLGAQGQTIDNLQRTTIALYARTQGILSAISAIELPPDLGMPVGATARARRTTTVASLASILNVHAWLAIYGTSGSGKTELAILVAQARGNRGSWLTLRDMSDAESLAQLYAAITSVVGNPPGSDRALWYDAFCVQLGCDHVLVLDDLPRFEADSQLGVQLAQLAIAFGRHGVKLLTTSALAIPSRIVSRLGNAGIQSVPAPSFTNDETAELLVEYGATAEWNEPNRTSFINVVTKGHAELLVTAAFFLRQHEWRSSHEELGALLDGGYALSTESEVMRRLITTVPDELAQSLLFRTTLFKKSFTVDDMNAIANVAPAVPSPRKRLTTLEGLWLQRDQSDRLMVCPLVSTFGSELETGTRRGVHNAMGLLLVRRPRLNFIDMRHAIDHFVAAEEYNRAGTGLVLAMQEFYDNGLPEFTAGLTELWASTPLPSGIDLGMRIFLRILQAAVRNRANETTDWLLRDLAALTEQVTETHSYAFFALLPHVELLATHDFRQFSRYLRQALRVQSSAIMPSGEPLRLPAESALEYSVWHQGGFIANEVDLRDWMQTLRSLTHEQLCRLKGDDQHYEIFPFSLTSKIRFLELEAPGRLGGWDKVDEILLDVAKLGDELELDLLWASAHRDRIIVRAEHQAQLDDAIALAEDILTERPLRPACQILILECTGRLCLEKNRMDKARLFLKRAVELSTESYGLLRLYSLIEASRTVGENHELAFRYLQEAIALAQCTSWIPKTELTKALGELALLTWTVRGMADTVPVLNDALENFLACKPEGDDYKEVAVILGYLMGYLSQVASGSIPVGQKNEPLPTPPRGVFLSKNPARLREYDPIRVAHMPIVMSLLANSMACDDYLIKWANFADNHPGTASQSGAMGPLQMYLAADMVRNGDYRAAMRMFSTAVARIMAGGLQRQTDDKRALSVDAVLASRSSEERRSVEIVVLQGLVLPAVFYIASVAIENRVDGAGLAARFSRKCYDMGHASAAATLWQMAGDIVEASFGEPRSEQVLERFLSDDSLEDIIRAIARVGFSLQESRRYDEALTDQLATVWYAQRSCSEFSFRQLVTPFVARYWVNMVQQQSFRFTPPALAKEEIQAAAREPLPRRAKAVLLAAASGLGIRNIPPVLYAWLRNP